MTIAIVQGRIADRGWLSLLSKQGSSSVVMSSELATLVFQFFRGGGWSHSGSSQSSSSVEELLLLSGSWGRLCYRLWLEGSFHKDVVLNLVVFSNSGLCRIAALLKAEWHVIDDSPDFRKYTKWWQLLVWGRIEIERRNEKHVVSRIICFTKLS